MKPPLALIEEIVLLSLDDETGAHLPLPPFALGLGMAGAVLADLSMAGYLFYGEELTVPLEQHTNLMKWLDRIQSLPGWKHPYDLMPRGPVKAP